jgi:hypothetical protein
MTRSLVTFLAVGLAFVVGCSQTESQNTTRFQDWVPSSDVSTPRPSTPTVGCQDTSARFAARAYVLSIPLMGQEKELIALMERNANEFAVGGGTIRCMNVLGNALIAGALGQFGQFRSYSAQERFGNMMPAELAHLPGQVDDSLQSYGSDAFAMGQELVWLARVLPPAAQGDYGPYNAAGTLSRQAMAQVLPIYQVLCQMDSSTCELMVSMFRQVAPSIEEQIYNLALQVAR